MEILGYLGALAVGVSLGIFGAGGSIIAIPVLIYLFKIEPLHATTYSFFIIGCTALIGAIRNIIQKNVKVMPALYFALSGVISIYIVRTYILKLIPDQLFSVNDFIVTKNDFILFFFSIVMACAGISMIISGKLKDKGLEVKQMHGFIPLITLGFIVGLIIAFAGVGGGFLITPALMLFSKAPIKTAIGTSLCIISINSFVGFFSSFGVHDSIDWQFLFVFCIVTAIGILGGSYYAKRLNQEKLKRGFGWFVIAMSIIMILNELTFSK